MDMEPLEYDDYGSDSILSTSFISFSDEREDIVPHRATTISFGTVEIRTFNRVVGDHPGCKTGPPISIGWEHIDHEAERLEVYEASRKRKAPPAVDSDRKKEPAAERLFDSRRRDLQCGNGGAETLGDQGTSKQAPIPDGSKIRKRFAIRSEKVAPRFVSRGHVEW
eukprot:CAMPEP_0116862882 /NCGR_PEP_ID=MMETSP0418-20121206/23892_1 /TAXON_ID=1158023 /ORGANISM="Astrosyne radiata, Strain 13vi08-1A" /LENGTH=165 /DNA_ID=CAMNT_0004497799 /DNA_START=86 /DNA_END=579 /DNA_ORIENTATION=-